MSRRENFVGSSERGAGTVLAMAMMTITLMLAFVGACLASWFGCIHRARQAADLAALAGAQALAWGLPACTAAGETAAANGTRITACHVDSNGFDYVVRVTVQIDASPHVAFGPTVFSHTSEAGHIG